MEITATLNNKKMYFLSQTESVSVTMQYMSPKPCQSMEKLQKKNNLT